MEREGISKSNLIGWSLTIALSILGAWGTINARVYEIEKQIELFRLEINNMKIIQSEQQATNKEIMRIVNRIDKGVTEIQGKLDLKADKKFVQ